MKTLLHIVLCILAVALVASLALCKTIRVPGDFAKVQLAVDAAVDGDTILVAEGLYMENIVVRKKITLASLFFLDGDTSHISRTILDGSNPSNPDSGSVLLVTQGSDTTTLITGFTIRNGTGTNGVPLPDGSKFNLGGGILCDKGGARIEYNIVTDNVVAKNFSSGAGICIWGETPYVVVRSNIIRRNRSISPIYAEDAGIDVESSAEISNNVIDHNSAEYGPCGGLGNYGANAVVKIINNTIVLNSSFQGAEGVGVREGTIYLVNNIFWNPGDAPEMYGYAETLFASNNLIRGDYYGDNHFSEDPAFADTVSFALSSSSPAISAGVLLKTINGMLITAPSKDIYGNPRPQPIGSLSDLGAVESPSKADVPFSRDPQMTNRAMTVDGLQRHYLLFTPRNYASIAHVPLLMFFHGATWTYEWAIEHGFNDIADREGFIVVYPDSYLRPSRGWDVSSSMSNDMKFANQLVDTLIATFKVDSSRVFVAGFSNGATMTFWYASYYGKRIRAIAPFAHTLSKSITSIPKPIPLISFMGTGDIVVDYNGSATRYSAEAGAAIWAGFDSCQTSPIVENLPDVVPTDNTSVVRISYPKAGEATPPVQLYKVRGGNHNLPGPQLWFNPPMCRDINGPEVIWRFFKDISVITDITQHSFAVPEKFCLAQNYPNPFNPSTTIKYELPKSSMVRLSVYDILGREVSVLVNERRDAGVHEVTFDGSDLASGVYVYRIQSGDYVQAMKFVVLK